jgi:hypothetical protein
MSAEDIARVWPLRDTADSVPEESMTPDLVGLVRRAYEASGRQERMNRLAEQDSASEDVLVGVVRALEEQLWMMRVQLPEAGAGH